MCCVSRRLCNTEKTVASSPTLSYPALPTLSAILLNRHVNNKRTTNKPIPHDIVFGSGRDRPASKKESTRKTRNLPNGLHEKRKNNHKQGSWRQLVDPNQVCHILIYTSHSGTAHHFFLIGLVGRGVGSEFSALLSSQRITAVNSKTDSPLARRQRSGHALGLNN